VGVMDGIYIYIYTIHYTHIYRVKYILGEMCNGVNVDRVVQENVSSA